MDNKIIGEVLMIPNERTLIISVVDTSFLKIGDNLQIFEKGFKIENKDKQIIGRFDFIKDTVEITEVYENYVVCKKLIRESTNPIVRINDNLKNKTVITEETININKDENQNLNLKKPYICIGDIVKKLD
jgi:hypothetical protein|nr:MAG TPA: Flagellar assembly protein T, C-terminal domain [Caudoviricetes sp.]